MVLSDFEFDGYVTLSTFLRIEVLERRLAVMSSAPTPAMSQPAAEPRTAPAPQPAPTGGLLRSGVQATGGAVRSGLARLYDLIHFSFRKA